MNIGRFRFLGVVFIVAAMLSVAATSHALPRLGRDAAGVVQRVDEDAKTFQLRRSKDEQPMTLSWNSRTRFIAGAQFVNPAKLREGASVSVIYRSPFFGERFVTKVVLGGGSVLKETRSLSEGMRSRKMRAGR